MDPSIQAAVAASAILLIAIGGFGAISYAMTAKNRRIRVWGCRTAAAVFFIFGASFILSGVLGSSAGQAPYLWSFVMFGIAGWQWRLSTVR